MRVRRCNRAPRRTSLGLAVLTCATPESEAGCSVVPRLTFANYCEKDVRVEDWGVVIRAGQVVDITEGRPISQRIRWKYADESTTAWDFIELNTSWAGPVECYGGHPSYSSYSGYNMASKYEALNPDTGEPACADMGAEVTYTPEECPTGPGHGYLCQGNPDCASQYSQYIRSCSNAINSDGTRTPTSKDTTHGANYVNFWCSDSFGFHEIVGTLINCVEHSVPFVLRITTCNIHGPPPVPSPAPLPAPSPVPSPDPPKGSGIDLRIIGGIVLACVFILAVAAVASGASFGRQRRPPPLDIDRGSVALVASPRRNYDQQ